MVKRRLQRSYQNIITCDEKSKETQTSFFLYILGNI